MNVNSLFERLDTNSICGSDAKPAGNFLKIPLWATAVGFKHIVLQLRLQFLSAAASAAASSSSATMESSRGPPRVKNKAPAPQQISAEQLLREAVDRQEPGLQAPTQRFADLEELHEFQGRKRKEFEDYVRRNKTSMNVGCSMPSNAT